MAKDGNAAFSPADGVHPEDIQDDSCYYRPAGSHNSAEKFKERSAYGGKPSGPQNSAPEGGWEKQGHMLQPLDRGFGYPVSSAEKRRTHFELNERDNFDPTQASPPRIKKVDD
jgi:hypothetical protein